MTTPENDDLKRQVRDLQSQLRELTQRVTRIEKERKDEARQMRSAMARYSR